MKLILKRSDYPEQILKQINDKKEKKIAEKMSNREFELNRLDKIMHKEKKDREFEIAKR
jgi:hypothetical protein